MKQISTLVLILIFSAFNVFAQQNKNPLQIEIGFNAVDVYPVGEDLPQGDYFDEFFNLNDHWNFGAYVAITKGITKNLSLTARGSLNEISKWGDLGSSDESFLVDNLKYYGLDAMLNYSFSNKKLQPYISAGGGYTWIEEGTFNTFSLNAGDKNLVGAGTVNGSLGVKYAITERLGLNLQTIYKHAFKDYLTKHWQHSLGITYKLGKISKEEEKEEEPDEPAFDTTDTDKDGIIDLYDVCPNKKGVKEFGGCPKKEEKVITPAKVDTPKKPKAPKYINTNRKVFFASNSAKLDNNAKVILDHIADMSKNANDVAITVDAYTDNKGSVDYNNNLSRNRANNVKNYLVSKGIKSNDISINHHSEKNPAASNDTSEGRALNRRAELIIKLTTR